MCRGCRRRYSCGGDLDGRCGGRGGGGGGCGRPFGGLDGQLNVAAESGYVGVILQLRWPKMQLIAGRWLRTFVLQPSTSLVNGSRQSAPRR